MFFVETIETVETVSTTSCMTSITIQLTVYSLHVKEEESLFQLEELRCKCE